MCMKESSRLQIILRECKDGEWAIDVNGIQEVEELEDDEIQKIPYEIGKRIHQIDSKVAVSFGNIDEKAADYYKDPKDERNIDWQIVLWMKFESCPLIDLIAEAIIHLAKIYIDGDIFSDFYCDTSYRADIVFREGKESLKNL